MNRKDADTAPNGCRHCGQPERTHCQRWWGPPAHPDGPGWHTWTEPTDAQRKERMLARRLGPSAWRDDWMPATKETLIDAEPYEPTNRVASAWNRAIDAGAEWDDITETIGFTIETFAAWWEAEAERIAAKPSPLLFPRKGMTDEEAAEWKQRFAETVTPRASQAATATNGPGDDHGAGAGQDNPAAANSGARMRPEDVPEELVELAVRFNTDCCHKDICGCDTWPDACHEGFLPGEFEHGNERKVIAAAIPAVRAAIADEIERLYNPNDPADDDHDEAIRDVIRHLRGLCTICGQAPDADPCGYAHAINLRGGR